MNRGSCDSFICHAKTDVSHHPVLTALGVATIIAIVVTGAAIYTSQSNIYNQYAVNTYMNPATRNQPSDLNLQFGFPLLQGVYPVPDDPRGGTVTLAMVNDPIYPTPVFRARYNATFYVDIVQCFFTTGDIRLNRNMPTQQVVYQGDPILCDFLVITEITTAVNHGTYILLSTDVFGGIIEFYVVLGAARAHFNWAIAAGWYDMSLLLDPIYVYPGISTTYILGQALVEWLFTMV